MVVHTVKCPFPAAPEEMEGFRSNHKLDGNSDGRLEMAHPSWKSMSMRRVSTTWRTHRPEITPQSFDHAATCSGAINPHWRETF